MYLHDIIIGLKRARADDTVDMLAIIIDKVEQRATEREERMRKMELEMQERILEKEGQREERLMTMFTSFMQCMMGGTSQGGMSSYGLPYQPYHSRQVPLVHSDNVITQLQSPNTSNQ